MFYHDSLYTQRFQTLVILLFDGVESQIRSEICLRQGVQQPENPREPENVKESKSGPKDIRAFRENIVTQVKVRDFFKILNGRPSVLDLSSFQTTENARVPAKL